MYALKTYPKHTQFTLTVSMNLIAAVISERYAFNLLSPSRINDNGKSIGNNNKYLTINSRTSIIVSSYSVPTTSEISLNQIIS